MKKYTIAEWHKPEYISRKGSKGKYNVRCYGYPDCSTNILDEALDTLRMLGTKEAA